MHVSVVAYMPLICNNQPMQDITFVLRRGTHFDYN